MRLAATAALLALAAAGCDTGASPQYAGMRQEEARLEAQNAMAREYNDPSSPLHGHLLTFRRLRRGKTLGGLRAWVAVYASREGERVCFRLRAVKAPFGSSYTTEVDDCGDLPPVRTTKDAPA